MIPHVQKGSTCAVVLGGAEADSRWGGSVVRAWKGRRRPPAQRVPSS